MQDLHYFTVTTYMHFTMHSFIEIINLPFVKKINEQFT